MSAVRMDVVVKHRQRLEDAAKDKLTERDASLRSAEQAMREAKERLVRDGRQRANSDEWLLHDLDNEAARRRVISAAAQVKEAEKQKAQALTQLQLAQRAKEAVRRVAEARREELMTEERRRETRTLDEIAQNVRRTAGSHEPAPVP